jgi:hypothetical protein
MPSISYPATLVPFSSAAQPSMMSGGGVLCGGFDGGFDGGWDGGGVDAGGGVAWDDGGFDLPELGAGVAFLVAFARCRGSPGAAPRTASRGAVPAAGMAGSSALVTLAGFGFGFSPALATA